MTVAAIELADAEILQRLIDLIGTPILVKDSQHRWVLVNDAMEKMDGRRRQDVLGKTDFDLLQPAQAEILWHIDAEVLATGTTNETIVESTDSAGNPLYLVTRKARLAAGAGGETAFIVAVMNDVTKYRLAEARARFLSLHDSLTKLPNRAKFYETLATAAPGYVVMLIDLDGFKTVNDTYGHEAGDELLSVVADRLRALVGEEDVVARLGGDEFAVLMRRETLSVPAVESVAAGICASLAAPVALRDAVVRISASVGISAFATGAADAEELIRQADAAMYEVKRGGRCGYRWHQPEP